MLGFKLLGVVAQDGKLAQAGLAVVGPLQVQHQDGAPVMALSSLRGDGSWTRHRPRSAAFDVRQERQINQPGFGITSVAEGSAGRIAGVGEQGQQEHKEESEPAHQHSVR